MRHMIIIVLFAVAGCSPRVEQSQIPELQNAPTTTEPNKVGENGKQFVGTYYRGDGTGFNLTLTLKSNGHFDCRWTGCLGVYGTSTGTWKVEGDEIQMSTLTAKGMMEDKPIGTLTITTNLGNTFLVQNNDREFYDEHGPSRYSCFQVSTPND